VRRRLSQTRAARERLAGVCIAAECITDQQTATGAAASNHTAFGLALERRDNRTALEFSIAQLRDEAAQPIAVV
jgi:hypothetical protein